MATDTGPALNATWVVEELYRRTPPAMPAATPPPTRTQPGTAVRVRSAHWSPAIWRSQLCRLSSTMRVTPPATASTDTPTSAVPAILPGPQEVGAESSFTGGRG